VLSSVYFNVHIAVDMVTLTQLSVQLQDLVPLLRHPLSGLSGTKDFEPCSLQRSRYLRERPDALSLQELAVVYEVQKGPSSGSARRGGVLGRPLEKEEDGDLMREAVARIEAEQDEQSGERRRATSGDQAIGKRARLQPADKSSSSRDGI
jgi:hypothetical protein